MNAAVAYPAPAKLNLMLRVTGRRADGYHLLQTVFRLIDFGDTLRFAVRRDGIVARVNNVAGVPESDDLTVRAARLLQKAGAVREGADITLEKRLPLGGGLGGGSSDAATTLLALNRLWELNWPRARLAGTGARIGCGRAGIRVRPVGAGRGRGRETDPFGPPAGLVRGAHPSGRNFDRARLPRCGFD